MNLLEFSILYLACGAPFGVYYFIHNFDPDGPRPTLLKRFSYCLLISLFWLPFAIKLFAGFVTKRLRNDDFAEKSDADAATIANIANFEAATAQILLRQQSGVPVFEFRETFHRYVGLTLASAGSTVSFNGSPAELYDVVEHENPDLASICLNRRNRSRLAHHQILAREDFLHLIEQIIGRLNAPERFAAELFNFAGSFIDPELPAALEIITHKPQTNDRPFVKHLESEVWIPTRADKQHSPKKVLNLPVHSVSSMMSKTD